jgi:hypothetical protein
MKRSTHLKRTPLRRDTGKATLSVPVPRKRKCELCKTPFLKTRDFETWCSPDCAVEIAKARRLKAERKADAAKRTELKPLSWFEKKAEAAVNTYVRWRDAHLGCVSCNKPATWDGQWHASHWRSAGAATAIRFNLWNIHKACSECNHFKSGNIHEYRIQERIGEERAAWLKTQNQIVRYSREYLERLAKVFNRKARRAKARQLKAAA